jgi:pSer/pThr/pTyr-binding forkhead associated (FHA) protein
VDLQIPLLAAKALLLLLLFAFVYAVVHRGVADVKNTPEETAGEYSGRVKSKSNGYRPVSQLLVEESEIMAPETRFTLKGDSVNVGRSAASDIVLKGDAYASGSHARMLRRGGVVYVEDAGSTNGTYVNGRRASGTTLVRPGDIIRIGSTTFRCTE